MNTKERANVVSRVVVFGGKAAPGKVFLKITFKI